jgi:hypothetical protein
MITHPPIRLRTTANEWITFACSVLEGQPIAVTLREWSMLCRIFNWDIDHRHQIRLCNRPIKVVEGEPAWFLTNT